MDLNLYFKVLWRFRVVVAAGLLLAILAAGLALFRIDMSDGGPRLAFRESETWMSASTLFVTEQGFPWGRTILSKVSPDGIQESSGQRFGDPQRYSDLATTYAQLAKIDAVRRVVTRDGRVPGAYDAEPVRSTDNSTLLPAVYVKGMGASAEEAAAVANRATTAFRSYMRHQQQAARIPPDDRVLLEVSNRATSGGAVVLKGRSFVRPGAVFLLLLMAAIGLAFVLENLRPYTARARAVEPAPVESAPREPAPAHRPEPAPEVEQRAPARRLGRA